jgi:hypothetical protein
METKEELELKRTKIDFEKARINALQELGIDSESCSFHFSLNIKKNLSYTPGAFSVVNIF